MTHKAMTSQQRDWSAAMTVLEKQTPTTGKSDSHGSMTVLRISIIAYRDDRSLFTVGRRCLDTNQHCPSVSCRRGMCACIHTRTHSRLL